MKHILIAFLFLFVHQIQAQNNKAVEWINNNLIEIENSDPDTYLESFDKNIPEKFQNAKIFGFGETTHHGKEFFDIKAKFFKYLVKEENVKAFLMEESYIAELGINEWISGGKGDIKTIAENFSIYPWHTLEVVDLLQWMRNYNLNKRKDEQIRFYGIDIQVVTDINERIRRFVKKYNLPVNEDLLSITDESINKKIDYKNISSKWADEKNPKLRELKQIILESKSTLTDIEEFKDIIRAIEYLLDYNFYIQNPTSQIRDLKMFENAKYIIDNNTQNGKAFIWAHNEHINNLEMLSYGSGWTNLGAHLKNYYKENYYSVGFDFGIGDLRGYIVEKNKPNHWVVYTINEPFKRTYSETLIKANKDIYFIEMDKAKKDNSINFFSKKVKQLILGGQGYNPKDYHLINKKFSEMYDGLIFIKRITVPNYKLNSA
tara:strand:- start:161 stop:1453 length:1293 start_codon:yes stop_codon:yes gene_type:complete